MERYLWIVGLVLVFAALWWIRRPTISPDEARRLVAAGARLLDVRTPGEFAANHLPGALNIPVDQLSGRVKELGPTGTPIIVYCQSGMRSASAVRILRGSGFSDVRNLGSIHNW
jgi:rhodanese-related sulfurtransferase